MECVDKMSSPPSLSCSGPSARTPQEYYAAHQRVVANLPYQEIDAAIREILAAHERGATIFTFGNGGSAALASHFACDLGKGTLVNHNGQKRFRVISLTDNIPLLTAWANDHGYEHVFARQLEGLVANTMKYLDGQPVVGVNPDPARWNGVLLPFTVADLARVVPEVLRRRRPIKSVTMAEARLNVVAHEGGEQVIGSGRVLKLHLE